MQELRLRDLVLLSLATNFSIVAFSFLTPVLVTEMTKLKWSGLEIGLVSSGFFIPSLLLTGVIPRVIARYGLKVTYFVSRAAIGLLSLLFVVPATLLGWFAITLVLGICIAFLWPITEAFVAKLAPSEKKGTYTGIYQTFLGLAFASGPFLSSWLSFELEPSVYLSTLFSLLTFPIALAINWKGIESMDKVQKSERVQERDLRVFMLAIMAAAFVGGVFESGLNSISQLLALDLGFSERSATLAAGVIGVGSLLAQYPIGVAADKWGFRLLACIAFAILFVINLLLMALNDTHPLFWTLPFLWGGGGGGG
jgi:MFS family permease